MQIQMLLRERRRTRPNDKRIQRKGSWCVVTSTGRKEEAEVKERLANWAPLRIARRAVADTKHNPARSYAYAALAE